jgi:membrane-associated phospholipid phosphatase
VWRRVQALAGEKLLLTATIGVLFWLGYSVLARQAWFPLRVPPRTWLDEAVPFHPELWAWIYLSQFGVSAVLPWLINTRELLRRHVTAVVLMTMLSFAVFLFFPVASPRVPDGSAAMRLIHTYDGGLNAFPSLHAAFAVVLTRLAWRVFGDRLHWTARLATVVWAGAVLYSTLATRQHYAADVIAGAALGAFADGLAWRRRAAGISAATTMSRSSGVAFHDGCK